MKLPDKQPRWFKWLCYLSLPLFFAGFFLTAMVSTHFIWLIIITAAFLMGSGLIYNILLFRDMLKNAREYNDALDAHPELAADAEAAAINAINHTDHNQELVGTYQLAAYLRAVKDTPKKGHGKSGIFGLVVLVTFIVCVFGFIVCLGLGQILIGMCFWGAGVASILICLIVHLIHKKIATNRKYIDHNQPTEPATVISCVFSDQSSFGTGSHYHTQTNRILHTTYLVYLEVAGEQKKAYSQKPYNKGDTIYVYRHRKLKDMVVIAEK